LVVFCLKKPDFTLENALFGQIFGQKTPCEGDFRTAFFDKKFCGASFTAA